MGRILLSVICLLFCLLAVSKAQPNDAGSGSGSGSGSGVEVVRNCSDLRCSHGCNETEDGAACYCPRGYSLGEDMRTCQPCQGGMFGVGCSNVCNCTSHLGNTCDRVSGMCQCNPCYMGDRCETESGSTQCFVQFLEIIDKSVGNLRNSYGGVTPYPVPPESLLRSMVANDIMETSADFISNVMFNPVSRAEVGQGPLVKLSWLVDGRLNPQVSEQALSGLSDKVKLGNLRATYIAQRSGDNTLVTLNAGVKEDPI